MHSKADVMIPVCAGGKCSVNCKVPDKESVTASAQNTGTLQWVSGKGFKAW